MNEKVHTCDFLLYAWRFVSASYSFILNLLKCAVDDLDFDGVVATDETDGVEAQVVAEVHDVAVRVFYRGDRDEHHLVPVWVKGGVVFLCSFGMSSEPALALILGMDDETGDVAIFVTVESFGVCGVHELGIF